MRKTRFLLTCVLLATAGVAQAADPWQHATSERGLMLYMSKPVNSGNLRRPERMMFGMRLQQRSILALNHSVPLLDLRYTLGGRRSALAAGTLMWDSSTTGPLESLDSPVAKVAVIGAVVIGLACVTELGICKGKSSNSESPGL
ncbi:MAG: hypothetical protein IPG49_07275 [Proteobacteria bacterium]|nr:hypothetical protein [Pseudomonadota bacterium]